MDDKIINFLIELYWIWKEEEKRFLFQLKSIPENDKEKLLVSLYKRYEETNRIEQKFDRDLKLLFNKAEESFENILTE